MVKIKSRSRKQLPPKATVTPGPYTIYENSNGAEVKGVLGVAVAWFGTNGTYGVGGAHSISPAEARANAELFVAALQRESDCGPKQTN